MFTNAPSTFSYNRYLSCCSISSSHLIIFITVTSHSPCLTNSALFYHLTDWLPHSTNLNVQRYIAASCLPQITVFFPCFHFSLPLTSPLLLYVLFSSTCISVMTCIEIGYRNNFITHSCTRCVYSCAINLFKKNSPWEAMHRCQRLVHPSKQFWNWFCGMAFRPDLVLLLISSMSSKRLPFNIFFYLRNRKMLLGARSGE